MNERPITEDDLQAYVDKALDGQRESEVAAYLAEHPDIARRTEIYNAQRTDLRAALAPIAAEPLPPNLNLAHMIAAQRRSRWPQWAAAAAILLMLGGSTGWSLRGLSLPPSEGVGTLTREAAMNFNVYASDHIRPVELRADDQAEFVQWASRQLDRPVNVPDLAASGYRFMGGRLVATAHGPAALFMYDNDHGTRLVVLSRRMAADRNMPMAEHHDGAVAGFAWSRDGIGYSLVGIASPAVLHPLANEIRRQTDSAI